MKEMPNLALSHLKVLEMCNFVTGPYCSKLLADQGAEVIKIESPGIGDDARRHGPFLDDVPDPERSGFFLYLNTNKMGVTLDITTVAGKRIFKELIKQTDIFIEDNPPEYLKSLQLSYDDLKVINPRLVMTSITPFGETGPYRDYKAHALNSFHASGEGFLLPIQSTEPEREPVKGGSLQPDCICGLAASSGTLAAAFSMNATGIGQHVEVSKYDVLMTMVLLEITMFINHDYVRTRHKRPLLMPIPMKCQDGYIQMSSLTEREWNDVIEFMGNPSWADDERFSHWLNRHILGDEITPHIEEFVQNWKKEELFHKLQEKAIAAVPVNTTEDVVKDQQMEHRGFFVEMDHPKAGKLKYPTAPYKYSETSWGARYTAPILGQHNESIYCDRLGYDKNALVKFRESGAI